MIPRGPVEYYQPHGKSLREAALDSDLAHALVCSICAIVIMPTIVWLLGIADALTAFRWTLWAVLVPFVFIFCGHVLRLCARLLHYMAMVVEASVEVATQRDLNRSGAIGDVKLIEPPIDAEPSPPRETPAETRGKFLRHVEEFHRRAQVVGLARSEWLKADGARENYRFVSDGETLTREEYEDIIKALEVRGRRQGRTGELAVSLENRLAHAQPSQPGQVANIMSR